jgi:hypothetical protein
MVGYFIFAFILAIIGIVVSLYIIGKEDNKKIKI